METVLDAGEAQHGPAGGQAMKGEPRGATERMSSPDGCNLHPHCLTCPLAVCQFDAPGALRREALADRNDEIRRLRRGQALSVGDLARRFGVSEKTAWRVIRGDGR